MPAITFDRFYRYDDLTELIHGFARECPDLVSVESIGKSHEGRDIWVATVTNSNRSGTKTRVLVDGNIHATEGRFGGELYFSCTDVGTDRRGLTRVIDTRTFYVCPLINHDGAEWALSDRPRWIRSSTRPLSVRRGGARRNVAGHRRRRPNLQMRSRIRRVVEGSAASRG